MLEPSAKLPWLGIILTAAFLVRLAAAFAVQQWVERTPGRLCLIEGDAEGYWELGRKLARGDDYSLYDPPRRVMRMPGFPMLLAAGIEVFGERVPWLRIVLAAVGTAACGLVYGLAHELFGRTIAVPAGLCAALLPTFVIFSVLLLSETLFATTLLVSLIALAKLAKSDLAVVPFRRVASLALIAGLSVGMATLVRPTWLLIGPGFVVVRMLTATDRHGFSYCAQRDWRGALRLAIIALAPFGFRLCGLHMESQLFGIHSSLFSQPASCLDKIQVLPAAHKVN
jgi:uncharacterized membrane protein